MDQIRDDIAHIKSLLNEVVTALKGDSISRDGGLFERVNAIEMKISKVEDRTKKTALYVHILWLSAGAVLMAIFSLIIKR